MKLLPCFFEKGQLEKSKLNVTDPIFEKIKSLDEGLEDLKNTFKECQCDLLIFLSFDIFLFSKSISKISIEQMSMSKFQHMSSFPSVANVVVTTVISMKISI